jgi:hypothetical protein
MHQRPLELLDALGRQGVVCITRLRLDAALYEPAAPRLPGTNGRPRTKGARLPNLSNILAGCLLGLFSIVTLLAARLEPAQRQHATTTAWYRKQRPTFSDTLAAVPRHIWREQGLLMSRRQINRTKPRPALQRAMANALCHAT